ncbi:MAG: hypothetical protein COA88_03210 [Kordia sp.]|nr:MAG: hypothetical protein COA88_03210 [Kordia sp.]
MHNVHKNIRLLESTTTYPIVLYIEAKKNSIAQITEYFRYVDKLIDGHKFHYIIDLSDTNPPSTEVRILLKKKLQDLDSKIVSYSVIIGSNYLLKIALKFVGSSVGLINFKTYKSVEDAVKFIENGN